MRQISSIPWSAGLGRATMLALVLSLGCHAGIVQARPARIQATQTTITSSADRMISYRCQDHMWQTADGATHVLVNTGLVNGGPSLQLFSTYDGGANWVAAGVSLPDSNSYSTSDGFLDGNQLYVTYDTPPNRIGFAVLQYDATQKAWTLNQAGAISQADGTLAATPAVGSDALGRLWLAFTQQDLATQNFSIKLFVKTSAADPWADTGVTFGDVDNVANERSARPIRTTRGIGVVYTQHADTYWAERNDSWPLNANWPRALIYTKQNPGTDPYGSHFSLVADDAMNMHMFFPDGGALMYSRYLVSEKAWKTRKLAGSLQTAYMQATISGGALMAFANANANVAVFQSIDGGDNFTKTTMLKHPAPTGSQDYTNPRMETPAHSTSPVPVLQQYFDGSVQRAMFFPVPSAAPAAPAAATRKR